MSPDRVPIDLSEPRRTSPFAALFGIVDPGRLRALLPVVIIAIGSGRLLLGIGIGGIVLLVVGVASWWRRVWWFDDEVLHLDEGIIVRSQRRIPVGRVQHVEIERRVRHRLFGLAALRVETAAGSDAELRLDAVALPQADRLRELVRGMAGPVVAGREDADGEQLAPVRTRAGGPAGGDGRPEVLVRLSTSRLLLAGITGPEVLAVLGALGLGVNALADLGVDPTAIEGVDPGPGVTVVLAFVALPVWLLAAGLVAVVRRWGLTATIWGDELRVRYGLIRQQEFAMSVGRVQDVRIAERLPLRPFHRADVRLRSAASGGGESSRVDIPLLGPDEIDRILAHVLPAAVPRPRLVPAPTAARRRAVIRGVVVGAVVGAPLAMVVVQVDSRLSVVGIVPVAVAVGLSVLGYRGLGWAAVGGVHHNRSGALVRTWSLVPVTRIQSAAVVSTLFQRRRSLASVRLDLAAGSIGIIDRDHDEAVAIAASATSWTRTSDPDGSLVSAVSPGAATSGHTSGQTTTTPR